MKIKSVKKIPAYASKNDELFVLEIKNPEITQKPKPQSELNLIKSKGVHEI